MQNTEHDVKRTKEDNTIERGLHVAVGVIKDSNGEILISLRHNAAHQGGLWEFPGGKVERGESVEQALFRELKEELDILVEELEPLIKINHQYQDLKVYLDVWSISSFSGKAMGCEGQAIKWVRPEHLINFSFPAANNAIVSAARLPSEYAILNDSKVDLLLINLNKLLDNGIKLIQARIKLLSREDVMLFFELAMPLCKDKGALLLVNSAVAYSNEIDADGLHLTSADLLSLTKKPEGYDWVAASCHDQKEIRHAQQIGVDFIVLAPVLSTKTHPDTDPIGWESFKQLTYYANIPVFALGGMTRQHIDQAKLAGAQGISGITAFLE